MHASDTVEPLRNGHFGTYPIRDRDFYYMEVKMIMLVPGGVLSIESSLRIMVPCVGPQPIYGVAQPLLSVHQIYNPFPRRGTSKRDP